MHLPAISALRAFEASARHLNFTQAAEELNVTQSAVSHQIRHLEDVWNLRLFVRQARRLALTEGGRALLPIVRGFFEDMTRTLERLHADEMRGPLRVSALHSFSIRWLVPRLPSFSERHPDIDVWISTSDDLVDFSTGDVDVAIRMGGGRYPGLHATLLFHENVYPVCSREFHDRWGAPETARDLLRYPLLILRHHRMTTTWAEWFRAAGIPGVDPTRGVRFPDTNMALQAALAGQGVVLARSGHVGDDLAGGRLIRLLDVVCRAKRSYFLVCPEENHTLGKIAAFREWLVDEATRARSLYDKWEGNARRGQVT